MQDDELILQQLRENNPFKSHVSPNPFENTNPDLQQLNREISSEIEQLLRDKRRRPLDTLAGLILGGPGAGKTHMLMRILRRLKSNGWPAIFVNVRTFRNPDSVTQDLLSEVFISLTRKNTSKRSQFDMLMSEMINSYREHRRNDGFLDISKVDMKIYLARDMPGISKNFLKCLMMYIGSNEESDRTYILEWLRAGLDDEDSLRLGLPLRNLDNVTNAECESEAEKILLSLGLVLGYSKVPMMLCFDQLDAMPNEKELINAWGRIISFLVNNVGGMLPLAFMRPDTWNDKFSPVLDKAIVSRFNRKITMSECSIAQAQQLVRERLNHTFQNDGKESLEEKYNWLMERLRPKLIAGSSPRTVLELADATILNPPLPSITIEKLYAEECKKIHDEASSWPPNADHLTLALEVWLKSHEGFVLSPGDGKTVKFLGSYAGKKFMFIITASKSHFVMSAGLKRGISFMSEHPDGLCFYISERKLLKKTYKQANSYLREFETLGGKAVLLNDETRISWYAFMDLINQIDGGNVSIFTSSGNKQASREDLRALAGSLRLLDINFGTKSSKTKPLTPPQINAEIHKRPNFDENALIHELKNLLNASPIKLLAVDKTLNILAQRGFFVESEKFLSFAKSHREEFRVFQTKTETLIGLTEK